MYPETKKELAAYLRKQADELDPSPAAPTPARIADLFAQIEKYTGSSYRSIRLDITRNDNSFEEGYTWEIWDSRKTEFFKGSTFSGALAQLADAYAKSSSTAEQAAVLVDSAIEPKGNAFSYGEYRPEPPMSRESVSGDLPELPPF